MVDGSEARGSETSKEETFLFHYLCSAVIPRLFGCVCVHEKERGSMFLCVYVCVCMWIKGRWGYIRILRAACVYCVTQE